MTYRLNKRISYRNEYIAVALLYATIFFIITTAYWWFRWYTK